MRNTHLLVVVGIAGCIGTKGSGTPAHETRTVGAFTKIESGGALDVAITQGPQSVEVDGDDNLVAKVTTEVQGDRLVIETHGELRPKLPLRVTVHAPAIAAVRLSGAGHVTLSGVTADELALDVSGAGDLVASGTATHLVASVSGAGNVNARALHVERADAHVTGSGNITIDATKELAAEISGAGNVRYTGSPTITKQQISGAGSIRPL